LARTFQLGLEDFNSIESIEDGLGPAFNAPGCGACHNIPVAGGGGNFTVLRAGRRVGNTFVEPPGGSLIHVSATDSRCQPRVPANANVLARRLSPPLFGAGLVEAIPDETLRNLEEQQRRTPDFIRGRAAIIRDPAVNTMRVGRFGWKAQLATLLAFAGDAYVNEMGITNDIFPNEAGAGLSPQQLAVCDTVPGIEDHRDPATGHRGIDLFAHFMRFLAPVEPLPATPQSRRGEAMFAAIGCATCHVPVLMTGPNPVAALDRKPVRAYSDFLLHNIGAGDGIEQGAANGDEMRTAPLWGLRHRKMLMHDGRALSVEAAIEDHGMEALPSRMRYRMLAPADRAALLAFLGGL
jgi:CxxC motif-containing protein (DUF1111 family)